MSIRARILSRFEGPVQRLRLGIEGPYHFVTGQYLSIEHPDGTQVPLSIASTPDELPELELHYRSTPGDAAAAKVDEMLDTGYLTVSLPAGRVLCPEDAGMLLLIAGGVGASQAIACARHRAHRDDCGISHVVWCADNDSDIYAADTLTELPETSLDVVVDPRRTAANLGLSHVANLDHAAYSHIILCGSPPFVYAMTDVLEGAGVNPSRLAADVYDYAPRQN